MCTYPSVDGWTHPRCARPWGIDRLIVGLPYRGLVQTCLKRVKYQSQWDRITFLYKLWRERVITNNQLSIIKQDEWIITSVPMWKAKERERGFNQAAHLAQLVADYYKARLPARQIPNLVTLERMRETMPMYGLDKRARRENVAHAFGVRAAARAHLVGKNVLIVDDVWTTGATLRACTLALKRAGCREVWALTLAR